MRSIATIATLVSLCVGAVAPFAAQAQEYLALNSRQSRLIAPEQRPHVAVARRADFFVRSAVVVCDTRDPEQRRRELEETMAALMAADAEEGAIEMSILRIAGEDAFAIPLDDLDLFKTFIAPGSRPDTSEVRFLVKTPIGAEDDLETVTQRLEAFRAGVPTTGRTEVFYQGEPELSLVDPRQYRLDVVQAIADDAQSLTDAMGENYAVRVTGLEQEMGWRRSGDLELSLFISHKVTVVPRP